MSHSSSLYFTSSLCSAQITFLSLDSGSVCVCMLMCASEGDTGISYPSYSVHCGSHTHPFGPDSFPGSHSQSFGSEHGGGSGVKGKQIVFFLLGPKTH